MHTTQNHHLCSCTCENHMRTVTQQKVRWKWQAEEIIHWSNNQTKATYRTEHECFVARRCVAVELQNCHCSSNSVVLRVTDEVRVFRSVVDLKNCNEQLSTICKMNNSNRICETGRMDKRITRKHSWELQNTWQSITFTLQQAVKEKRGNKGKLYSFFTPGKEAEYPMYGGWVSPREGLDTCGMTISNWPNLPQWNLW